MLIIYNKIIRRSNRTEVVANLKEPEFILDDGFKLQYGITSGEATGEVTGEAGEGVSREATGEVGGGVGGGVTEEIKKVILVLEGEAKRSEIQ